MDQIVKEKLKIQHEYSNLGILEFKQDDNGSIVENIPLLNINNNNVLYIPSAYYEQVKDATNHVIELNGQERYIQSIIKLDDSIEIKYYGDNFNAGNTNYVSINLNKYISALGQYKSQYGLQGKIFSFLDNNFGLTVKTFYKINCFLLALVITLLSFLMTKIFSKSFAFVFIITIVFSPWVVSFARNLYWITFSWFLPALFSWMLYFKISFVHKVIIYIGIFSTCLFKCLSGYEYFSSVLLFATAPYVFRMLTASSINDFFKYLRLCIYICFVGTIGFTVALLMHAYLRTGGNIISGLNIIWHNDVLRRTHGGNVADFDPVLADSLRATTIQVVKQYILHWNTTVISLPILKHFSFLSFVVMAILCSFRKNLKYTWKNIALIISFSLPALSWFIMAKSHSFVHTHMNFVLWYMGGVAVMFYIIFESLLIIWNHSTTNSK